MEIDFLIGDQLAKLQRNWFFGSMKLLTPKATVWLQHPLQVSTHLSFRRERNWSRTVSGHDARVE